MDLSLGSLAWWKEAAGIIQAAFFCATAVVALLGVDAWHRQILGKRRVELAEQALASFYEIRDVFGWVRSPGSFGGEGEAREAEGEREDVRRLRNTYFVPVERMQKRAELFARLLSQRYAFMAVFGPAAARPFDILREVQVRISVAARTLIRLAGNPRGRELNEQLWDRCEADIWDGIREADGEVDPIKTQIDLMIETIEGYCRPVLLHSELRQSTTIVWLNHWLNELGS